VGASIEVETWSLLPHGSGLGGSSILSATVLAALARLLGRQYALSSLTHLVLKVEQMLSTGGGWQDQVGGMYPGVKASACAAGLPVAVSVLPLAVTGAVRPVALPAYPHQLQQQQQQLVGAGSLAPGADAAAASSDGVPLPLDPALSAFLDAHLVLVYTGRTRLAKNLLQRVLRQWAVREGGVTQRVADLRATAVALSAALAERDPAALGAAVSAYWEQKKGMAPLAEPPEVTALIHLLREGGLIHGCSLTGAGGGGFMVLVCRSAGGGRREVEALLRRNPQLQRHDFRTHACAVDPRGLVLAVTHGAAPGAASHLEP
jgi:fucokinase